MTIEERIQQIKAESAPRANTAHRVGEALEGLKGHSEEKATEANTASNEYTDGKALEVESNAKEYTDDKASLLADKKEVAIKRLEDPYSKNQFDELNIKGEGSFFGNVPNSHPERNNPTTTICFVTDGHRKELFENNGRPEPFVSYKSVFDTLNAKFAISMTADSYDDNFYLSIPELLQMQDEGYELMSHVFYSVEGTLAERNSYTTEEAYQALKARKELHTQHGFNVKNGNWFQSNSTIAYRSAARKLYRAVCRAEGGIARNPIDQYNINRSPTMDSDINLNKWKGWIDDVIEQQGLLIFYGHIHQDEYFEKYDDSGNLDVNGEFGWQKVKKLVEYITEKPGYGQDGGVKIDIPDNALDDFENAIELGDRENGRFFHLSKRGSVSTAGLGAKEIPRYLSILDNKTVAGFDAERDATGGRGVSIGAQARRNATGEDAVAVGQNALFGSAGNNNTAIGFFAGNSHSGKESVLVGSQSGQNNDKERVVLVGSLSGVSQSGINATGVGYEVLRGNTGHWPTAVGFRAMRSNSGSRCFAAGWQAGRDNTGHDCVLIGYQAGFGNTIHSRMVVESSNFSVPLLDGDFQYGGLAIGAPSTTNKLADSRIGANRMTFYLDETANKLHVRVKYADGTTIKEGEVALV